MAKTTPTDSTYCSPVSKLSRGFHSRDSEEDRVLMCCDDCGGLTFRDQDSDCPCKSEVAPKTYACGECSVVGEHTFVGANGHRYCDDCSREE